MKQKEILSENSRTIYYKDGTIKKKIIAPVSKEGNEDGLNESDINTILAALVMGKARYNTADNGGIFYDFTFPSIEKQNEYAQNFEDVEMKVRKLFP